MIDGTSAHDSVSLDALENAATEEWGDGWKLELTKYDDGTFEAYAAHSNGVVDEKDGRRVLEEERLMPGDDGEIHFETVRFVPTEVVDRFQRTDLPEQ